MRLFALVLPALAFGQAFLEEDLLKSKPHREAQYEQLKFYAESLPPKPEPHGDTLRAAIGYPAPALIAQGAPREERIGEDALGVYSRLWIRLGPGVEVYGLYLVPKNVKLPRPLVVALHGGAGFPELALFHGGANYHDMIRGALQEGYVVWAPLTVMHPRRDMQNGGSSLIPADVRKELDALLRTKGTSLAAVEVTKIAASLDVLLRRKEIDARRVGITGLSYGAYYTMYAAALDKRITAAAGSCGMRVFPAVRGATADKPDGRLVDLDAAEVARFIYPRPLHLQFGLNDEGLKIADVRPMAEQVKAAYAAAPTKLDYVEFDGKHEFRGEPVWAFFRKWLQ
ncbi:MAG: dienelactone hydrolase family protein [Acidobacteria bacterium]|nr:dienelactone hydrolase family protein [Acidobacteriota bacterium]